jgi:hypothetical protein
MAGRSSGVVFTTRNPAVAMNRRSRTHAGARKIQGIRGKVDPASRYSTQQRNAPGLTQIRATLDYGRRSEDCAITERPSSLHRLNVRLNLAGVGPVRRLNSLMPAAKDVSAENPFAVSDRIPVDPDSPPIPAVNPLFFPESLLKLHPAGSTSPIRARCRGSLYGKKRWCSSISPPAIREASP